MSSMSKWLIRFTLFRVILYMKANQVTIFQSAPIYFTFLVLIKYFAYNIIGLWSVSCDGCILDWAYWVWYFISDWPKSSETGSWSTQSTRQFVIGSSSIPLDTLISLLVLQNELSYVFILCYLIYYILIWFIYVNIPCFS